MIGKIGKSGKGFTGTINYLLDGPRGPEQLPHRVTWTETRNLFDPDPRRTARYMRAIADTSTRVTKPVYHFIISWTDGHLTRMEPPPIESLPRTVAGNAARTVAAFRRAVPPPPPAVGPGL